MQFKLCSTLIYGRQICCNMIYGWKVILPQMSFGENVFPIMKQNYLWAPYYAAQLSMGFDIYWVQIWSPDPHGKSNKWAAPGCHFGEGLAKVPKGNVALSSPVLFVFKSYYQKWASENIVFQLWSIMIYGAPTMQQNDLWPESHTTSNEFLRKHVSQLWSKNIYGAPIMQQNYLWPESHTTSNAFLRSLFQIWSTMIYGAPTMQQHDLRPESHTTPSEFLRKCVSQLCS